MDLSARNEDSPVPTYEYACSACDTRHDIVQAMTDDALTECPSCHQPTLRKLFGSVGVVFKGSGFYRNDSRSTGTSSSPASDAKKDSSNSSTSGSDSTSSGSSSDSSSTSSSSTSTSTTTSTPTKAPTTTAS